MFIQFYGMQSKKTVVTSTNNIGCIKKLFFVFLNMQFVVTLTLYIRKYVQNFIKISQSNPKKYSFLLNLTEFPNLPASL